MESDKKIIILKNDRTGDLFVSLSAINKILNKHPDDEIIIFLSKINHKFSFLFQKIKKRIFNYNLNIAEKIKIIFYLFFNKIDTVYILSPKNFYFYLPLFFKNIKFYGLTIYSKKSRPNNFLKRRLFKYVTINRLNLGKRVSSYKIQESLIEDTVNHQNLIKVNKELTNNFLLPKKYLFFHYKHRLFNGLLNWDLNQIKKLLEFFSKNYENVIFSSELHADKISNFFKNEYNYFDYAKNLTIKFNDKNIYYLHEIDGYNLFNAVNNSNKVICPEGIISHMGYFCKKDTTALLHFELKTQDNLKEQLISCKEWFPPNNYKFCVLKKDFKKSLMKLIKRI